MKSMRYSRAKKSLCGRVLRRLLGEEKGAVAMEYIVIALLVAAAIFALVGVFGDHIAKLFHGVTAETSSSNMGQAEEAAKGIKEDQDKTKKNNDKALEVKKNVFEADDGN